MDERDEEIGCGKCGLFGDKLFITKLEVTDGLEGSEGEENFKEIYLCTHCSETPDD